MIELTDEQIARYFHRCFSRVDGLWFMKVEEKYGFDTALEIDHEVWKVMPKIQSRMLKPLLSKDHGLDALREAFEIKLDLEGFTFETEPFEDGTGFSISISECPWNGLMVKAGREHLAERVGQTICNTEYALWAQEFGDDIQFELAGKICGGNERCALKFTRKP